MTSLIVGGGGFIGAHVTDQLCKSGRDVLVIGRSAEPRSSLPTTARYMSVDYGNHLELRNVLEGVEEIVHLAYATVPKTSFEDPVFDVLSNLPPTVQLFQEAISARVSKVVLVSSGGTVYGVAESIPITEAHPTRPISPYGISKLAIEKFAAMFHATADLPVVVVRPANAYGEGQRPHGGQGFIAVAVRAILEGSQIDIFGPEGTTRDYVDASDVATGIVSALERGVVGETYNIGTGIGRTNAEVLSVLEPLASRAGFQIKARTLPRRVYDVPANVLDSRRLNAVAGWQPRVDFDSGVERVWERALREHGPYRGP